METIEIHVPEGKTAIQENQKGKIIINFKDKPKGYIMDRVKTFEDACIESGIFPEDIYHSSDTSDEIAYKQLKLIAKVLRGEWEPNWNDENEKKWYPWFQWSSGSGFDFSSSYYGYGNTYTSVGSRLCFPKKELAEYFGKQFIEIHRELLTIKK